MKIVVGNDELAAKTVEAVPGAQRLEVKPVHKASRRFLDGEIAEVCELAIVTLLQAAAYDKPVALLPVTMLGRHQHQTLVTMSEPGVENMRGLTIGVRSWSQTTGVWLRGFLTEQYGVGLSEVDWVTYEDGHVNEYTDPTWVRRATEGAKLPADFLDGKIDYGIMGNELPSDDRIRTVIPEALEVAGAWATRHGFAPVNHVVAFHVEANPNEVLAVYDALAEARRGTELSPVGFEALRGPITTAARYAFEQEVLPRPVGFDELVERSCSTLGVPASRLDG